MDGAVVGLCLGVLGLVGDGRVGLMLEQVMVFLENGARYQFYIVTPGRVDVGHDAWGGQDYLQVQDPVTFMIG